MLSGAESCIFTSVPWMRKRISPRSLANSRLIGLTPVDDILQHTTLKEGILREVFKQKAARAWFGCRAEKAQITVLLPGSCSLSEWSEQVDGSVQANVALTETRLEALGLTCTLIGQENTPVWRSMHLQWLG